MAESKAGVLKGLERVLVHNQLRAAVGLRGELPLLLRGVLLPPGARCLEIGTGLGWAALGLAQRLNPELVLALDYDKAILPKARAMHRERGVTSGVEYCCADGKALPFSDGTFDLVLGLYVLHHLAGYHEALDEIARVTRPGGRFLFIDPVHILLMPRLRRMVPPDGLPSRRELTALAAEVGLDVERWRGLPFWVFVSMRKQPRTFAATRRQEA